MHGFLSFSHHKAFQKAETRQVLWYRFGRKYEHIKACNLQAPSHTTTKWKFCVCQKSAHTKIHKTATKITYRPSRKGMHKFGARDIAFSWMLVLTVATDNADVSYLHPSLLCLYIVPLLLPQTVHSVRSRLCPYGG
jgi:hypothetical protein